MGNKYLTLSELHLQGQFLGFISNKAGKYKYLQLAIPSGNVQVKLPKDLRLALNSSLTPGDSISVCGVSKLNPHTGKIKLKARQVNSLDGCPNKNLPSPPPAKIMVCQKSGCLKRGGRNLLSDLEKTLCDRGLLDQVKIERTGCQKRCSSAPNCILQLGNKKYKQVQPEAIASLLENHFHNLDIS